MLHYSIRLLVDAKHDVATSAGREIGCEQQVQRRTPQYRQMLFTEWCAPVGEALQRHLAAAM